MSERHCPNCQTALQAQEKHFHCVNCQLQFQEKIHCDICGEEVETLKACGAVDYFCNHCQSLKSKSKVIRQYHQIGAIDS